MNSDSFQKFSANKSINKNEANIESNLMKYMKTTNSPEVILEWEAVKRFLNGGNYVYMCIIFL